MFVCDECVVKSHIEKGSRDQHFQISALWQSLHNVFLPAFNLHLDACVNGSQAAAIMVIYIM